MGTRNDNGEALVSFMAVNGFFACNTAFQHASRHKTTWTGWLKDQNAPPGSSKTIAIYTQIDFVLCKQNAKLMLQDARAYGGSKTCSDHKPVVARLRLDRRCLVFKQPKKQPSKMAYDTPKLVSDEGTRLAYLLSLNERIGSLPTSNDPNARLESVLRCVKEAASETIGMTTPHHRRYTQDPVVAKLSTQQRALRLQIEATGDSKYRTNWRSERRRILRQINQRLQHLACCRADTLASEITSTDDSRKMFRAVKAVKSTPKSPPLCIHDPEGKFIATDKAKADTICKWFEQQPTS